MMQRAARRARRAQHRGLHLRLSRLAARRLRQGAVAGASAARAARHRLPARPQRGPRRHRRLGHPAGRPVPRRARSTACSASGTARVPASTAPATRSSTPTAPAPRRRAACWRWPATTTARSRPPPRIRASTRSMPRDADALPGDVQDISRSRPAGLRAVALLRLLGRLQGVTDTVDGSASVHVDPQRVRIALPSDFEMPPGGLDIRWPRAGIWARAGAAAARPRSSRPRRPSPAPTRSTAWCSDAPRAAARHRRHRQGLPRRAGGACAAGHRPRARGRARHRVYKVALVLAAGAARRAAPSPPVSRTPGRRGEARLDRGASSAALYNVAPSRRPRIVGKTDETGAPLLPEHRRADARPVARAIVERLSRLGDGAQFDERLARLRRLRAGRRDAGHRASAHAVLLLRLSAQPLDRVPEGSRAWRGIGCHGMAAVHARPPRPRTLTHMGGEGAHWIGMRRSSSEQHVFQNLGDGTYFHSGSLAIRAASPPASTSPTRSSTTTRSR